MLGEVRQPQVRQARAARREETKEVPLGVPELSAEARTTRHEDSKEVPLGVPGLSAEAPMPQM